MRSFFFRNDGIVLDRSVSSRERTIVPQERRPALDSGRGAILFTLNKTLSMKGKKFYPETFC